MCAWSYLGALSLPKFVFPRSAGADSETVSTKAHTACICCDLIMSCRMAPPAFDLNSLPGDMLLLVLYHYLPNRATAIAAVILYAVVTLAVAAVTILTRAHYMWTVAFTGLLELTGEQAQHMPDGAVRTMDGSRFEPENTLVSPAAPLQAHACDHAAVFPCCRVEHTLGHDQLARL